MAQVSRPASARMTRYILDTSAIMAILLGEPGQDLAAQRGIESSVSSVNLAEILAKCVEKEVPTAVAREYMGGSGIRIVAFDAEMALEAGELFKSAKKGVLSLGDRACIATAMVTGGTAITADRVWTTLDLPCPIELIR